MCLVSESLFSCMLLEVANLFNQRKLPESYQCQTHFVGLGCFEATITSLRSLATKCCVCIKMPFGSELAMRLMSSCYSTGQLMSWPSLNLPVIPTSLGLTEGQARPRPSCGQRAWDGVRIVWFCRGMWHKFSSPNSDGLLHKFGSGSGLCPVQFNVAKESGHTRAPRGCHGTVLLFFWADSGIVQVSGERCIGFCVFLVGGNSSRGPQIGSDLVSSAKPKK